MHPFVRHSDRAGLNWLEPTLGHVYPVFMTFQVGIVGASGYTGQGLHALLTYHPEAEPFMAGARSPEDLQPADRERLATADAVALALPGEPAKAWTSALRDMGTRRILDLSDAHRCEDGIHYGQPELFGAPPAEATLVANPGCYPTATLLALRPLLTAGAIEDHGIAVVGASGASGAGKGLRDDLHFSHLHDNLFPYKVGRHRHIPEIERHLGAPVSFVTELLPVVRGLMVTAFVRPKVSPSQLHETLLAAYEPHPYVTVLDEPGTGLGLRQVVGSHDAAVAVGPVERSGLVPVFATIDNLMKGAASQAVHNLNLWLGLDPFTALPSPVVPSHGAPPFPGASGFPPKA